jgi:hypothetical protein
MIWLFIPSATKSVDKLGKTPSESAFRGNDVPADLFAMY